MNKRSDQAEVILPVQKQLEAYNAKDIDAFMTWWAEDCQYYEFPSRLLASGAAAIRDRHITRFKEPNLFAALIRRIAVANVVVDQETVTRTFPEGPGEVDVVAIYEVEDGKISKAWFKMGPPRLHPPAAFALRPGTADDADAIRALTREAYVRWVPIIGREPMPMTVDYHEAVRRHRIELLHIDGKLVGLIEMIPEADHLLIENVAVSPDFQGRGFGRKLMAHAEQVAATLGHSTIRLYTNKSFDSNIRLYKKLGYGIDQEEPFMEGITVYMSRFVGSRES